MDGEVSRSVAGGVAVNEKRYLWRYPMWPWDAPLETDEARTEREQREALDRLVERVLREGDS